MKDIAHGTEYTVPGTFGDVDMLDAAIHWDLQLGWSTGSLNQNKPDHF
jgi:hypothetical protein